MGDPNTMGVARATVYARQQAACFVCGQENARGLRIVFQADGEGEAFASWSPEEALEGFRGIVHGGVVSTVLDEAMSKAVAGSGMEALTAELKVRFRARVRSGMRYEVRGRTVKIRKRVVETEAEIRGDDGEEYARAWGKFLRLHPRR